MKNKQLSSAFRGLPANRFFSFGRMAIFAGLIAIVGGSVLLFSSSAATMIVVRGKVVDTRTGKGIAHVKIDGCSSHGEAHVAYTTSEGVWAFQVTKGYYYCARVVAGIPAGYTGPSTIGQRSGYTNSKSYENQVAGYYCTASSGSPCNSNAKLMDRSTDTGLEFRYSSPTPKPTISSFTAAPSTITAGAVSKLSWTSSGGATSCKVISGTSSSTFSGGSGSTNVKPSKSTSYSLTCTNAGGNSPAKTLTVTVNAASSGGGTSKPSGNTSSGNTSNNRSSGSTPKPAAPDKTPPSIPQNFVANVNDATKAVQLQWQASTDNIGVASYQLERSADNHLWTVLNANIKTTTYDDNTANFSTSYYYRLRATDTSKNNSDYASTQVNTGSFEVNTKPDADTTITSDDQVVSILIPADSLDKEAFCAVSVSTDVLAPDIKGNVTIGGPYELVCRDKDSNLLTTFAKPLILTAHVDSSQVKGISQVNYYGQAEDGSWQQLTVTERDAAAQTDAVELGSFRVFSIMGQQKKSPWYIKLILIILVIAAIIFLIRFITGRLLRRKAEDDYDEYLRKAKGL